MLCNATTFRRQEPNLVGWGVRLRLCRQVFARRLWTVRMRQLATRATQCCNVAPETVDLLLLLLLLLCHVLIEFLLTMDKVITLSGGSLGSPIDEERSKAR